MSEPMRTSRARLRRGAVSAIAVTAVVAAGLGTSSAATAADGDSQLRAQLQKRADRAPRVDKGATPAPSVGIDRRIDSDLAKAKGPVSVMVELDTQSGAQAFTRNKSRGQRVATGAERDARAASRAQASKVVGSFGKSATKAKELYRASGVYSGVAVTTDASRLKALSSLPGVKAIHTLTPKSLSNASSVPLVGAPAAWAGSAAGTGKGVKVGVIDTGIDYTHTDFGGTGDYKTADAKDTQPGWETAKVVGGYDFAGDSYNADPASADFEPVPTPDPNPLDCNGHGTHVSGTSAGYGVNKDGSTYAGPWNTQTPSKQFEIGPGVAPQASLYGLRVFGCEGSTNLVIPALEWAFDHDLDVVNMSLGSSYGSPQDPDAVASNNLSAAGTVVVASIGNSGDVYEIGGSPGNATRAIAVAASDDGASVNDAFRVDSPADVEPADPIDGQRDNLFAASRSIAYAWGTKPDVTNQPLSIVGDWSQAPSDANNIDGCTAYSAADTAKIKGTIVMQMWLDGDGRRCGSKVRADNAAAAGAVGDVMGSDSNTFSAGITGSELIPAELVVKQGTDAILAALAKGEVRGTLSYALRNTVTLKDSSLVDMLASFSSRGIGVAGSVKPDVAAPGASIFSASVGTGHEGETESGTSMAAPHVAGQAALVVAAHPGWTPEQVKAAIMNTATEDVHTGANKTGPAYGPERVGAGRIRVDRSVTSPVLAYNKDDAGAVSVSFGPVEATRNLTLTKTVSVQNTGDATAGYKVAYRAAHDTPGAAYSVTPRQVTVPAGTTKQVTVTLKVKRAALRHVQDPTTDSDPLGIGLTRSFRTDASGRVVLTPTSGGNVLRVPVWSAPRPASAMSQADRVTLAPSGLLQKGQVTLSGSPVAQGTGASQYTSTVSGFQLQMQSKRLPDCLGTTGEDTTTCVQFPDDRAGDLKYAGSASDAPSYAAAGLDPYAGYSADSACTANCTLPPAMLSFGISTWGPWRTAAGNAEFDIYLDGNGDKTPDAVVYNTRLRTTDDYDYFVSTTLSLPAGKVIDQELTNVSDGSFENGLFNSDAIVMPVSLYSLAQAKVIKPGASVGYQVVGFSSETGLADGDTSATAEWKKIDVGSPGLQVTGDGGLATLNTDAPRQKLDVTRNPRTATVDKPQGLLLLHHLNATGDRAQVVDVR